MAADRQIDIYKTSANAVTLVWGSLRLAPIMFKCAHKSPLIIAPKVQFVV